MPVFSINHTHPKRHLTKKTRFTGLIAPAGALLLAALMFATGSTAPTIAQAQSPVQIGLQAPDFTLTDLVGNKHTLSEYTAKGQTVVLEWFSPACPFVKKHYRDDTNTMLTIQKDLASKPVVWLRINSTKSTHPASSIEFNKKTAEKWGISTPILLDPAGTVGHAYGTKRTPEMYIIDSTGILVYHGAIDNRPDAEAPGEINFVRNALTQTLASEPITQPTTKAYGCWVKY